jgi:hypothetical protein
MMSEAAGSGHFIRVGENGAMASVSLFPRHITLAFSHAGRADPLPGQVFRHTGARRVVETAEVLSVAADWQGIPHVCFRLTVTRANLARFEARRTLTLSSFRRKFTEPVEAVTAEG